MKCSNCNHEVDPSWKACPFCLTPIVLPEKVRKTCSRCGEPLDEDIQFCPWCGMEVKREQDIIITRDEEHIKTHQKEEKREPDLDMWGDVLEGFEPTVLFKQLGILVLDGSGSMQGKTKERISKAEAVSKSVRSLFQRFKDSSTKNDFCFAIVNYDSKAIRRLDITEVDDLDVKADYNPMKGLGNTTSIAAGLKEAERIADGFLSKGEKGGVGRSVVIVVMTDGLDMTEKETIEVANRLKQKQGNGITLLATSYFDSLEGTPEQKTQCVKFLQGIASDPDHCKVLATAEEMRKFFHESVSFNTGTERLY